MFDADYNIIVVKSVGYETVLRHSHSFVEIVYVKNGKAVHNVGGKSVEIKKGDVFVIATSDAHSMRPVCEEKDFVIINILCDKKVLEGAEFPPPTELFSDDSVRYERIVNDLVAEYNADTPSEEILRHYVLCLLNLIGVERVSRLRKSEIKQKKRHSINYYIQSATGYIHENYMKSLTLGDIASAVALYPAYLQKLFRENRNTGVIEYLIHYRMEKSSQFLLETTHTVEEISRLVGINDLKNFYTMFKRYFFMTPIEYRVANSRKAETAEPG
jgi:AraC-like DNA-binding protein